MWLSAIGFVACFTIHAAALFGMQLISERNVVPFFAGSFIVYVPAVLVANWLARNFKQKECLKAALRGCPRWMRTTVNFLGAYAVLSFIAVVVVGHGEPSPKGQAAMFSAYGMAFDWTSFAILFSAMRVKDLDAGRCCLNGHSVSPLANYCEQCGAPVKADAPTPEKSGFR
jgi:hypothetical protein